MTDARRTYPMAKLGFGNGKTSFIVFSGFGPRTLNGQRQFHRGIDLDTPQGGKLYAPFSGEIVTRAVEKKDSRDKPAAGLYLVIKSEASDGTPFYCYMMHLHSVEDSIYVGKTVNAGDLLGTTGGAASDYPNCGNSKGAHLHFEIRVGSRSGSAAVNPDVFLRNHKLTTRSGREISITNLELETVNTVTITNEQNTKETDPEHTEGMVVIPQRQATTVVGRPALGIWQIVKLLMDTSVNGKQICDSSIATQTGHLINFFNKVCQKPFVEFMGETFGNQYYFIVRRPPFDQEGFQRMMSSAIISIDDEEIMSTELQWANQNIYSWYRYIPKGDLLGGAQEQFFIPAVFFPEFASIWGSRPMCIESNYFNYMKSGFYNINEDDKAKENARRILIAALKDFKYLVESNAYNPFTRMGTITLRGNRQIKRGTLVHLPTGEVFHVDAVSQNYSVSIGNISRSTTLQLSRGIFPDFIGGKEIDGEKKSYFNIIDFGDWDESKITLENYRDLVSKWKVNYNVFSFFLRRQQMLQDYDNGVRMSVSVEVSTNL